jgi:hypothetical protein
MLPLRKCVSLGSDGLDATSQDLMKVKNMPIGTTKLKVDSGLEFRSNGGDYDASRA